MLRLFLTLRFMNLRILFSLMLFFATHLSSIAQEETTTKKKTSFGPRARVGIAFQYSSNFKNLAVSYPALNYTGQLGGYTGRGGAIFAGYKFHKYLVGDFEAGFILNSYSLIFDADIFIQGRFHKFYVQPTMKFVYPLIKAGFGTINPFIGGGIGLTGSGRLYLEEQYYGIRDITYARFDPMLAPIITFGAEVHFDDLSNIIIGFNYQNGAFDAKEYSVSYLPNTTLKNAPEEIKTFSAQGIALRLGIMHEF
jgi:hypothetical protein